MTTTTKVLAWIGAIFGTLSIAAVVLIVAAMMYAGSRNSGQQRQQQQTVTALKQGLEHDLQNLSHMQIKPMTEEDRRKWLSGASSPTPTPEK